MFYLLARERACVWFVHEHTQTVFSRKKLRRVVAPPLTGSHDATSTTPLILASDFILFYEVDPRSQISHHQVATSKLITTSRHPSNIILHRPPNLVPGTTVVSLILDANHQHTHTVVITHTHHTYARTHTTDLHACIPTSIL